MLGLDAQFSIISYAVISTKYEKNQNISICFIPLIEHVLLEVPDVCINSTDLSRLFKETYGYEIPMAIMNHMLKSLKRQGKIEYLKGERIEIVKDKLTDYEDRSGIELSLRSLMTNIDLFFKESGVKLEKNSIINQVLYFIIKNSIEFNSFFRYNSNLELPKTEGNTEFEDILVSFLIEERRNNTDDYKFIKDIYYGVILATLIASGDSSTVSSEKKLNIENVIFDSNYIFRLLDLQTKLEHMAAQDTYKALKDQGCEFWVARATLKQVADSIHSAIDKNSASANSVLRFVGEEQFAGLASACLRRNLSASKLERIVASFETVLTEQYGVKIVDDKDFDEIKIDYNGDDFNSLCANKPSTPSFGIAHDLRLIYFVRAKRSSNIYCMQQAKWWVLTDDYRLTKWNVDKVGKKDVCECITESQLATVMWLNEPQQLSNDSLFNTALALRNRSLISNDEFEKISESIERQSKKYRDNPEKVDRFALVFSQRLINLEDLADAELEQEEQLFADAMIKADELSKEKIQLLAENEQLKETATEMREKHDAENKSNANMIKNQKSLLSAETMSHIETLKKLASEKQERLSRLKMDETLIIKKQNNQKTGIRIVLFILASIVTFFLARGLQKNFEDWYYENELLVTMFSGALSGLVILFGLKMPESIRKFVDKIAVFIVKIFSRIRIMKDYEKISENINKEIQEVVAEINDVITEINLKSEL